MKTTFTSLLLLLGLFQKAQACDCIFIPTFCEAITFNNNGQVLDYLSIYVIKVNAQSSNGLHVFISQTYFGENLTGHNLFMQDGNGADCVLFASSNLTVGSQYIVAANVSGDTMTLSDCTVSFLPIDNGIVKGAIAPGVTEVALAEFPNTVNCGDLSPSEVVEPGLLDGLIIRPTLTSNWVEFRTKSSQVADLKLTVFDAAGRLVLRADYPDFGFYTNAILDLKNWSNGIYFLHFEVLGGRFTQKVLKAGSD